MKYPSSVIFVLAAVLSARGQAPGVRIEKPGEATGNQAVLDGASKLLENGKLLDVAKITSLLEKPVPENVPLPASRKESMSRQDIYKMASRSRVRVGWYFLCHKCNHWHTRLAGGYPLTADGVIATCHHVAQPDKEMREGYLIVVDAEDKVSAVTSILADSAARDISLLRTTGGKFQAIPLNDQIRPGDAAFCLSDPLGINGYFTEGMVNRFYHKPGKQGSAEESLRLHVSTDWAPGSSGSPVLDECGNAIGHVSTISSMTADPPPRQPARKTDGDDKEKPMPRVRPSGGGGTQIVLHEASTARGILELLRPSEPATAEVSLPVPEAVSSEPAPELHANEPESVTESATE